MKNKTDGELLYDDYEPLSDDIPFEESVIEQVGAEAMTLELLAKGMTWQRILKQLRAKYPDDKFTKRDLDLFLVRNDKINQAMIEHDAEVAERHVEANLQFKDKLVQMQTMIYNKMQDAASEDNYTALAALHNSILNGIKLYSQMDGTLTTGGASKGGVTVNIGLEVGNVVEDKNESARTTILEVVDAIDADLEDEE